MSAASPYTVYADKRTNGYYIRYTDPLTKRRITKPLRRSGAGQTATKNAAEAQRLAGELWVEVLTKVGRVMVGAEPEREVRVDRLIPAFLEHLRDRPISKAAKRDYGRHMKRWVEHTSFAKIEDVRHVDGPVLQRLAAELLKTRRNSRRTRFRDELFTRKMVRAQLITLNSFFNWVATHHGVNIANPVGTSHILAEYAPGGRGDDHFYQPEQVDAFLRSVDRWRYTSRTLGNREIAYLLAYTGARIGEVLALRASAINFCDNTITFDNLKRTRAEREANLRKTRTIRMWPRLRSVLLAYVRRHGLKATDVLFPMFAARGRNARRGARNSGPYEWLKSVCKAAGIPYRSGHHVWRHTYVSARARMHKELTVLGRPDDRVILAVGADDIQREVGHVLGSTVTHRVYMHAQLQLPALAVVELDWAALADAVRQQRDAGAARFGDGYHESDVERMSVLASPQLRSQIVLPPTFT